MRDRSDAARSIRSDGDWARSSAASIASDRAQLARDEAKLATDKQNLAQTRILAPAAGVVTAVDAEAGQSAAPAGRPGRKCG